MPPNFHWTFKSMNTWMRSSLYAHIIHASPQGSVEYGVSCIDVYVGVIAYSFCLNMIYFRNLLLLHAKGYEPKTLSFAGTKIWFSINTKFLIEFSSRFRKGQTNIVQSHIIRDKSFIRSTTVCHCRHKINKLRHAISTHSRLLHIFTVTTPTWHQ